MGWAGSDVMLRHRQTGSARDSWMGAKRQGQAEVSRARKELGPRESLKHRASLDLCGCQPLGPRFASSAICLARWDSRFAPSVSTGSGRYLRDTALGSLEIISCGQGCSSWLTACLANRVRSGGACGNPCFSPSPGSVPNSPVSSGTLHTRLSQTNLLTLFLGGGSFYHFPAL